MMATVRPSSGVKCLVTSIPLTQQARNMASIGKNYRSTAKGMVVVP